MSGPGDIFSHGVGRFSGGDVAPYPAPAPELGYAGRLVVGRTAGPAAVRVPRMR